MSTTTHYLTPDGWAVTAVRGASNAEAVAAWEAYVLAHPRYERLALRADWDGRQQFLAGYRAGRRAS